MTNYDYRPLILVCILAGSERHFWINPQLAMTMCAMAASQKYRVMVRCTMDLRPFDTAANTAVTYARDAGAEWLIIIENDQCHARNPLDVLDDVHPPQESIITLSGFVVGGEGLPVHAISGRILSQDRDFVEIEYGPCGTMFINHRVWQTLPGPWFEIERNHDEKLTLIKGHDYFFCEKVRAAGFKVWTHKLHGIQHFHTLELARLACQLAAHGVRIGQAAGSDQQPL
jgi:hypothetical protein